ncbi:unnamed protein product (mitochondrion) [Plasmodiophora brassicae]|uniref:Uncharacterized protein n=1 Tax=Plasmodiophora brassicae TaxID=37360 RepID=A0A0G4IJB7_PLABS|nr:hypothetical protein PBRA_004064 [Plasmodiophora brassicae]SPQ96255.1 unnamed protein product [Plasmodiophora brassicae]
MVRVKAVVCWLVVVTVALGAAAASTGNGDLQAKIARMKKALGEEARSGLKCKQQYERDLASIPAGNVRVLRRRRSVLTKNYETKRGALETRVARLTARLEELESQAGKTSQLVQFLPGSTSATDSDDTLSARVRPAPGQTLSQPASRSCTPMPADDRLETQSNPDCTVWQHDEPPHDRPLQTVDESNDDDDDTPMDAAAEGRVPVAGSQQNTSSPDQTEVAPAEGVQDSVPVAAPETSSAATSTRTASPSRWKWTLGRAAGSLAAAYMLKNVIQRLPAKSLPPLPPPSRFSIKNRIVPAIAIAGAIGLGIHAAAANTGVGARAIPVKQRPLPPPAVAISSSASIYPVPIITALSAIVIAIIAA